MRRWAIGCGLVGMVVLLVLSLCHRKVTEIHNLNSTYTPKNEAQQKYVSIHNCVATPDSVKVPNNTELNWVVASTPEDEDLATYVISFSAAGTATSPVQGLPIVSANSPDSRHIVSIPGCTTSDQTTCGEFEYLLIQRDGTDVTVCPDPGVRVIPNAEVPFFIEIWLRIKSIF
ncbi:MAG: hypothetical protein WAK29_20345 [Terriglobales bacterium]